MSEKVHRGVSYAVAGTPERAIHEYLNEYVENHTISASELINALTTYIELVCDNSFVCRCRFRDQYNQ